MISGYPFTVTSGVDNARTGTGGQRTDLIGDPNLPGDRPRGQLITDWLRKSAFARTPLGTFGTLGRNTFEGGYANVDFGLAKNFAITERITTTFRFEAFNAFNRVNLILPAASQTSGKLHENHQRVRSTYFAVSFAHHPVDRRHGRPRQNSNLSAKVNCRWP